MNTGKLVFAQVMAHLPLTTLRRCVARYDGEHKVKHFSLTMFERTPLDQLLARIPPSPDQPENPNQLILFN